MPDGNSTVGVMPIGTYTGDATAGAAIDKILSLIPNPDIGPGFNNGTGAIAGGGFLDEMSPAAAVQLRVELLAAKAEVGAFVVAA